MTGIVASFYRLLRFKLHRHLFAGDRPRGRTPAARLVRRVATAVAAFGLITLALGAATDVMSVRKKFCSVPVLQPGISDFCGSLGVPGFPAAGERRAWEAVPRGDCPALQGFLARFPDGSRSDEARRLLRSPRLERETRFTPADRSAIGFVGSTPNRFPTEAASRSDALRRAITDAETILCVPAADDERLRRVDVTATRYECQSSSGGYGCSLDFRALCRMERQALVPRCD